MIQSLKIKFIILFCCLSQLGQAGTDFEGYKVAIGYGFGKQVFKFNYNRKLWEEDLIFDGDTHAFAGFFNDFTSIGMDLGIGKNQLNESKMFLGPDISYEVNLLFVQARGSVLAHINTLGHSNVSFRPEIGLTIIGSVALTYGYNWTFYKSEYAFNARHNLTFSISSNI